MAYSPKEIEEQFKADYEKACKTFGISKEEAEKMIVTNIDNKYMVFNSIKAYELYLKHSAEPYEVNLKRR